MVLLEFGPQTFEFSGYYHNSFPKRGVKSLYSQYAFALYLEKQDEEIDDCLILFAGGFCYVYVD